ncbi:MAG: serine/threonine-protein kinase, partial [Polyangiales bacterium]
MDSAPIEEHVDGRYRVLELLGRGGMGAVYRVHDERTGRELALKRLLASQQHHAVAAELFEREFHTLSQLAHPRIIEVYEYGVDAAGAYYTMELLGGQDLRALEKAEWRKACELLRDVASSLALLHSRRLVHCDVSPRNVRCTIDGHAKLLDFGAMMPMGVAKRVVGTPPFIAPELLQLQQLDGRTDLYGLGALGYYLLTGRHAYPARTARQLRDVWRKRPLAPSDIDPEIPPALSQLVMELLQHNRNARPRS